MMIKNFMVNWRNLCTADLNDGVGLITCKLLSVDSVVLGCHRDMVEGEVECVDDLEKVQHSVEYRVQTTTSVNET